MAFASFDSPLVKLGLGRSILGVCSGSSGAAAKNKGLIGLIIILHYPDLKPCWVHRCGANEVTLGGASSWVIRLELVLFHPHEGCLEFWERQDHQDSNTDRDSTLIAVRFDFPTSPTQQHDRNPTLVPQLLHRICRQRIGGPETQQLVAKVWLFPI